MEPFFLDLVKQAPAVGACIYIVILFLNHIRKYDERRDQSEAASITAIRDIGNSCHEFQQGLTERMNHITNRMTEEMNKNTTALARNTMAIERLELRSDEYRQVQFEQKRLHEEEKRHNRSQDSKNS